MAGCQPSSRIQGGFSNESIDHEQRPLSHYTWSRPLESRKKGEQVVRSCCLAGRDRSIVTPTRTESPFDVRWDVHAKKYARVPAFRSVNKPRDLLHWRRRPAPANETCKSWILVAN